jgi:hypothetical protein
MSVASSTAAAGAARSARLLGARHPSLWQADPRFRRIWQVSSVMWAGALLVDAALRVAMSHSLPVHTVPALSGLPWP